MPSLWPFAAGLAITFMMLEVIAGPVGGILGVATQWWYYLVAAFCFVIGLHILGVLLQRKLEGAS